VEDTLEARGSLQRCLDHRPEFVQFLDVPEGGVRSVAVDLQGRIAAGYSVFQGSGVVLFDGRGERVRPAPLEGKEGLVTSVAFDSQGRIAAGYSGAADTSGGLVLLDAKGQRLRSEPVVVKEGGVTSVAFDSQDRIAAGYSVSGKIGGGGVVIF